MNSEKCVSYICGNLYSIILLLLFYRHRRLYGVVNVITTETIAY